jgi:hypothetical protein
MPSTCFSPSASTPTAMQAGLFCTTWLSRTFTTIASRNTTAQTGSSGRACQAFTSSSTASVTAETVEGDSSVP